MQVVMVGDGITDLEAVQEGGGADLFIGFGGEKRGEGTQAGGQGSDEGMTRACNCI